MMEKDRRVDDYFGLGSVRTEAVRSRQRDTSGYTERAGRRRLDSGWNGRQAAIDGCRTFEDAGQRTVNFKNRSHQSLHADKDGKLDTKQLEKLFLRIR